jgi:hypothetical protein
LVTLDYGTDKFSRNVCKKLPTYAHNISKDRRAQIYPPPPSLKSDIRSIVFPPHSLLNNVATDTCAEEAHETNNCGAVRSRTVVRNLLHSLPIATTTTTSRQTVHIESDILRFMFPPSCGTTRHRRWVILKWILNTEWEGMGWINPFNGEAKTALFKDPFRIAQ